jgi:DMSO/TMAO reductase YedYZ molybdopterin-dependent catalytic subunit
VPRYNAEGVAGLHRGVGNAVWVGTPLAAVLEAAGMEEIGIEVVFWGTDAGDIELHHDIRDVKMHHISCHRLRGP